MRAAFVFGVLLGTVPLRAYADCVSAASYACLCDAFHEIAVVETRSVDGDVATVVVLETSGADAGVTAGAELTHPRKPWDEVGARSFMMWPVYQTGPTRLEIDGELVVCHDARGPFTVPLHQATSMALDTASCSTQLYAMGFQEPPCNDVVTHSFGCGCSSGAGFPPAAILAAVGWMAFAARARRIR